jgi:hypothetical protein
MHVATQTVERAHCDCGPVLAGGDNAGSELWSAIRRVGLAPVFTSTNSAITSRPSPAAKRAMASCCAASSSPLSPCRVLETRM